MRGQPRHSFLDHSSHTRTADVLVYRLTDNENLRPLLMTPNSVAMVLEHLLLAATVGVVSGAGPTPTAEFSHVGRGSVEAVEALITRVLSPGGPKSSDGQFDIPWFAVSVLLELGWGWLGSDSLPSTVNMPRCLTLAYLVP